MDKPCELLSSYLCVIIVHFTQIIKLYLVLNAKAKILGVYISANFISRKNTTGTSLFFNVKW